jgi:hypothetical protein
MPETLCYYDERLLKYTVAEKDYHFETPLRPSHVIATTHIELDTSGKLTTKVGYTWDGPSNPGPDFPRFMRASLAHDALYQLMRLGRLPNSRGNRLYADRLFLQLLREDRAFPLFRWAAFFAVRLFSYSRSQSGAITWRTKVCLQGHRVISRESVSDTE